MRIIIRGSRFLLDVLILIATIIFILLMYGVLLSIKVELL